MTSATSDAVPGPTPPGSIGRWVVGARPRTLPAAVVPVALGAAAAVDVVVGGERVEPVWWRVALALVVSLALQVAVNYANDYSDGIRGTDDERVGPTRLVASGLASPSAVKRAMLVAFGVAALAGLLLAAVTTWWLLAVGVSAIAAGWFYTGGPTPYGYLGLGEVFVFVFFGLVATCGTTFVLIERITGVSVLAGALAGSLACALLVVNNLRDLPSDAQVGKRTLAVRIGDGPTRWFYAVLILATVPLLGGAAAAGRPWALIGIAGLVAAVPPLRAVLIERVSGPALIPVLGATGRVQLVVGALAAIGIALA